MSTIYVTSDGSRMVSYTRVEVDAGFGWLDSLDTALVGTFKNVKGATLSQVPELQKLSHAVRTLLQKGQPTGGGSGAYNLTLSGNTLLLAKVDRIATIFTDILDRNLTTARTEGLIANLVRTCPFDAPRNALNLVVDQITAPVAPPPLVKTPAKGSQLTAPRDPVKPPPEETDSGDHPEDVLLCEGECPDGMICVDGACVPVADSGMDPCLICLDDETCIDGVCVPMDPCADCVEGETCVDGTCAPVAAKKSKWPWVIGAIVVGGGVYLATRK